MQSASTATAVKFVFPSNDPHDSKQLKDISRECTIALKLAKHLNIVKALLVDERQISLVELETIFPDCILQNHEQQSLKDIYAGKAKREGEISVILIRMELCGENLRNWLNYEISVKNPSLHTLQFTIVKDLACGLEYLHDNKIIAT